MKQNSASCLKRFFTVMLIIVLALLVIGLIAWWKFTPRGGVPKVSSGRLEQFEDFPSAFVNSRTISVWMPDGYTVGDSCDVVYMHDGQMLYDASTSWNNQEWQVDEIFSRMMAHDSIRPCIVVGIDNTRKRLIEYFPSKASHYMPSESGVDKDDNNFLGDDYLRFLVEELKPFIDDYYQPLTDPQHTFLMGSSMGGLISLYALCEYPQVFGGAACLSSHVSMATLPIFGDNDKWAKAFCVYVDKHLPPANSHVVYMDHGTRDFDADYGPYQEQIDSLFVAKGWDDAHYQTLIFEDYGHNEVDWSRRLDRPLYMFLTKD